MHADLRRLWAIVALAAIAATACDPQYEAMPADRVCLDTAYAVSNRVHACTGDDAAATGAFDAFQRETTCLVTDIETEPIAGYYACPAAILETSCDVITTLESGGDVTAYLDLSPKCPIFLEPRGGQP